MSLSTPSSLTLTDSNSDVTSSDVEIGSQQTMFVISDNKDNPSGCRAPFVESVEDKIRRLTPIQFLLLINLLLQAKSKGNTKPSRFDVANDLRHKVLLSGLVGGKTGGGGSWIALHPNWFTQDVDLDTPQFLSIPSTVRSNNSPTLQDNTPTPSSPIPFASTASRRPPAQNPDARPFMAVVPIPLCFQPLVTCLTRIHDDGIMHPLRSTVGLVLGPVVYCQAGTSSLKEYLAQAVDHGVVERGRASGKA
ncbi:uncharacterized protein EDB91DRAFT_1285472 [Suillus paluster]|uniref:uncharacterized protein n=1 Tax=Suillus paluster TaxID=48578 RepID=UPI001B870248|nr:uncharacterized protein EDB91DRAFT_1285472 [Suillus paluster]KAG1719734.1 hypothetical protein EDB91DRAFT_1285472 [Suillus paluster]